MYFLKRISVLFIFAVLTLIPAVLFSCKSSDSNVSDGGASDTSDMSVRAEYHKLSQEDAKKIMDGGDPYILVDVRTQSEYDEKHIIGAILIPVTEIKDRAEKELPDKNALIMVYCRSGVRSKNAAGILVDLGYANVQDIGGISTWPYDNVAGS